ncbi:hypothetical protein D3C81_1912280 [compost metagenome]
MRNGDADAQAHTSHRTGGVGNVGLLQALDNQLRHHRSAAHIGVGHDHGELFAAVARHQVRRSPHTLIQHATDGLQTSVAGNMPEGIIEALEIVDIDHQQGK